VRNPPILSPIHHTTEHPLAKLQSEVRRLQESLEEKRHIRLESSEHLIQDARSRLESVRNSVSILMHSIILVLNSSQQLGVTAKLAEDELTSVLESLVHDNEVLKRDNAELQHLLAESREDLHDLQEEVDEQRANPPSRVSHSGGAFIMFDCSFYTYRLVLQQIHHTHGIFILAVCHL